MKLEDLLGDAYKDGMSLEEVEKALESVNLPDNETLKQEIEKWKKASNKNANEAADYKRKYQEKLTAEEKAKEEREANEKALLEKVAEMEAREKLAINKSKFLALGYDDALATETAQAMVDGDTDKIFANAQKFKENQRAAIEAELLKKTPQPPPGKPTPGITREQYRAMSLFEKQKLATEQPELYKKLNSEE